MNKERPITPPRTGENGEWTTPKRSRALALLDEGFSLREVSQRTGVPKSTVEGWKKDPHSRRPHHRSGRPHLLTPRDIRHLIKILRKNWEGRKLSWRKLGKEAGLNVSGRTVKRALASEGYTRCKACKKPFISCKNQKDRRAYGDEHLAKPVEYWREHIYSDESTFDTSKRGSEWVTRLDDERYHDDCMQHTYHSGRGSVMVWGAISYNWKSELVFLKGSGARGVNAKDYMEQVLEPHVTPAFLSLTGWIRSAGSEYVEDAAPIHGTKIALVEVKKQLGIPVHKRPASSADLNPIENIWRTMKQRIKHRSTFPNTVEKMRKAVQEEWDRLRPEDWNKLIDSMPARIAELKERKGMQTQY